MTDVVAAAVRANCLQLVLPHNVCRRSPRHEDQRKGREISTLPVISGKISEMTMGNHDERTSSARAIASNTLSRRWSYADCGNGTPVKGIAETVVAICHLDRSFV